MIDATVKTEFDARKVQQRAQAGTFKSLGHAAAAIRLAARRLFRRASGPSAPGQPPHTHTRRMPNAIVYDVDRQSQLAVIGTAKSLVGESGAAHEHGGQYKAEVFQPRPFMRPALLRLQGRLPSFWKNSITG